MGKIMSRPWFQDQGNLDFLQGIGRSLMQNAGTQGFGALNDALGAGIDYRGAMRKQRLEEEERKEKEGREDTRWEHYMEKYAEAKTAAEKKRAAEMAEQLAERERRAKALEMLPPEQKGRLGLLTGEKFWSEWTKATGSKEPDSPTLRNFPDGSLRMFKPSDERAGEDGWVTLQEKPAGSGDAAPTTRKFPDGSLRQWNPASRSWEVLQEDEGGGGRGLSETAMVTQSRVEANRVYQDLQGRVKRALEAAELRPLELQRLLSPFFEGEDPGRALAQLGRDPTFDDVMALLPSYDEIRERVEARLGGGRGAAAGPEQEVQQMAAESPQAQQVVQRLRSQGKSWEEILDLMRQAAGR